MLSTDSYPLLLDKNATPIVLALDGVSKLSLSGRTPIGLISLGLDLIGWGCNLENIKSKTRLSKGLFNYEHRMHDTILLNLRVGAPTMESIYCTRNHFTLN